MPALSRPIAALLSLALLAGSTLFAVADPDRRFDDSWRDEDRDHDRARRAVLHGEALPVSQMLERLHRLVPGEVVGTRYEFEYDRWVYEFKLITRDGMLQKVHLDARTGDLVEITDR